jgi:uncharacterized membrane protein YfcA
VRRTLLLLAIGLVAGFLSALFGVGGGVVIVPALVAFAAYSLKPATATSLAAIGFTAVFGAARYGLSGDVHWLDAALIGIPAVIGVSLGTRLQRSLSSQRLQLLFSVFVLATGLRLIIS